MNQCGQFHIALISGCFCLFAIVGLLTSRNLFPLQTVSPALTAEDIVLGTVDSELSLSEPGGQFVLNLSNQGHQPIRIVGIPQGCFEGYCLLVNFDGPLVILPGESASVSGRIRPEPGLFHIPVTIYYDNGALSSITCHLHGEGIGP